MSVATDVLKHEHEAILLGLRILEQIATRAKEGKVAPQDAIAFLAFLREFADKCHHGKEEGFLFPEMIKSGLPQKSGPISVMLSEHEEGRALIAAMAASASPVMKGQEFAQAAHAYITHLTAHIDKENHVLFPMADRMIRPEALEELAAAFERHEEQVIGHGRHEELHDMLKDLKKKYLAN